MNVAVLYDYLETVGGGERVALTLAKHLDADLITTEFDPALPGRAGFDGVRVRSLGQLFRGTPWKQLQASWRFSRARLPGYDKYVLIGNWAQFAGRAHHPNLYYCLTPTRVFYDLAGSSVARLPFGERAAARAWIRVHRSLDRRAVRGVDGILAISENVRGRVRRSYGRDADVVYPPVATSRFRFLELGDTWLSVNRLYPEKRVDLQMEIFRRLPGEKLIVVGGYTEGDRARGYASSLRPPPNVTMVGEVPEERLAELYGRCRGFVTTAVDEDFGITPVEAMAAGKAVLATDEGGYRETVVHGRTGFLLPPDPEAFARTIRGLDDATLLSMRGACVARAREFDEAIFLARMRDAIGA
ncbi:MAG: glycosyltransferase family 4 protein [Methanobacteriota archaeon]|nr:MAG: glycosyltransferase family 4 protein [Euryarchaeota archaeon]